MILHEISIVILTYIQIVSMSPTELDLVFHTSYHQPQLISLLGDDATSFSATVRYYISELVTCPNFHFRLYVHYWVRFDNLTFQQQPKLHSLFGISTKFSTNVRLFPTCVILHF